MNRRLRRNNGHHETPELKHTEQSLRIDIDTKAARLSGSDERTRSNTMDLHDTYRRINTGDDLGDDDPVAGNRKYRKKKRPARILGMWARLALLSGAIVLLIVIAVAIVAKAIRPYREASQLKQQLMVMDKQIADTEAQNAAYQRRLDYLKTKEGIAAEARKLGYTRPGEVAIVVVGSPGGWKETPPPVTTPHSHGFLSTISQYWHSLFSRR